MPLSSFDYPDHPFWDRPGGKWKEGGQNHILHMRKKTDPVIKALRKAYKGSRQEKLDRILAEESKWRRRRTIADNKLREVRAKLLALTQEAIEELIKGVESDISDPRLAHEKVKS